MVLVQVATKKWGLRIMQITAHLARAMAASLMKLLVSLLHPHL